MLDEAESWATQSKSFMARTHKTINSALTDHLIGLILMGKGDYETAAEILERVLRDISRDHAGTAEELRIFADWRCPGPEGYRAGIASIIQDLGINSYKNGAYSRALNWLDRSTALAKSIGDTEGLARSLSHRGHALLGLGRFRDAFESYTEGLSLATEVQRKSTMGRCNQGLADVAVHEGRILDALRHGRAALNLFERLGMRQERDCMLDLLHSL
jgi:tetratricopeptide (TPR) repeat protein